MMKKVTIPLLVAVLCLGNEMFAQQEIQSLGKTKSEQKTLVSEVNRGTLSTRQALIKGTPKEVVFGTEPTIELHSAMKDNVPVSFKGQKYYYNHGDFFKYNGGRYLLIAPPAGMRLKELNKESYKFNYNNGWMFFYKGIFYKAIGNEFEVIDPPQGAIIYSLPPNTVVVTIDNRSYYEYLGVIYEKVEVSGEQGFEVVGILTEE